MFVCEASYTRPRNSTGETHRFTRRVPCEAIEKLDKPIFSIPVKEIENMLSLWLVEFLDSFLNENVHTTGLLGKKLSPSKFLAVFFRETRSCVRGLTVLRDL